MSFLGDMFIYQIITSLPTGNDKPAAKPKTAVFVPYKPTWWEIGAGMTEYQPFWCRWWKMMKR